MDVLFLLDYFIGLNSLPFVLLTLPLMFFFRKFSPPLCLLASLIIMMKLILPFCLISVDFNLHPSTIDASNFDISIETQIHSFQKNTSEPYTERRNSFFSHLTLNLNNENNYYDILFVYTALVILWINFSLLYLFKYSIETYKIIQFVKHAKSIHSGKYFDIFKEITSELKIKKQPKLIFSTSSSTPYCVSHIWGSKAIVIPTFLLSKNDISRYKFICTHELMHLKNHDGYYNLIREICRIIFHYHPIRYIADQLFDFYRETLRDIESINHLKITKTEYLKIMHSVYEEYGKRKSMNFITLQDTFVKIKQLFFKRLNFIYNHDFTNRKYSNLIQYSLSFLLCLMSILSFNPLAETQVVEKTIYVTDEIKTPPLPEASTDQIFDELTYSRFHDEKLWVIYPFTGIEIYNTENSRLERVSELQFSSLPFFIDGMEALDVVFFNNVIYIAFINSNSLDPDSGRISILEYNTNFELTEKGYIPTPLTNAIAIANNYLWIGERLSIYSIEGQLSIYDITTPLDPILIQEDIYDFAATELAYLESHHAMAAGIGFDIVFFNSIDSLDIKKAHNQLFSIVKILEIDDKKVACHTLELAGPFSSQFTPHLTIFDQNFDYSNIIKFEYQYPSKGYIFDEIIYTDNTLLISSKRSGLHILDLSLDEPELKAYDPTKVMLMAKSNKIIISNTESTSFYDPKIFSNEWSQIKDWNKH